MISEHQIWSAVNKDSAFVDRRSVLDGEYVADVRLKWRPYMVISLRVWWLPKKDQAVWSADIRACSLRYVIIPIGTEDHCIWLSSEFYPDEANKMFLADEELMDRAAGEIEHTPEFDLVAR
jgi:hypothetical protein